MLKKSPFVLVLLVGLAAIAPDSARADHAVYAKAAPSTVGFYKREKTTDGIFDGFYGSGVVVDVERKLVVTADHVVRPELNTKEPKIQVMFPLRNDDGRLLTEALLYKRNRVLAIPGKVIYQDRLKDLALVELEEIPKGVEAIPLARQDPRVGDRVHVIGNSTYLVKGSSRTVNLGAAFGYSAGTIRNVYHYHGLTTDIHPDKEPKAQAPFGPPAEMFFSLVHHAPANPGDSGGPVVNDAGELVGIVSRGDGGMVLSTDVHVKEVRRALERMQQPTTETIIIRASADSDPDLDSPSRDNFYVAVRENQPVHVQLAGNGRTNLDLYAKDLDDPTNEAHHCLSRLLAKVGNTQPNAPLLDKHEGKFIPSRNGTCLVQVVNRGDNQFPKQYRNNYTLTIKLAGEDRKPETPTKIRGPLTIIRQLSLPYKSDNGKMIGGKDEYEIPYEAGVGKARILIRTDRDMKLSLTVLDPAGKELAKSPQPTEAMQELTWTPTKTGRYTIRVESKGPARAGREVWSQYVLTTD